MKKPIPRAQARENPDPSERIKPVPMVLLLAIAGLFTWAVVYIATADLSAKPSWGDQRTLADLAKPAGQKADGAALFTANCVACHQATGMGVPGVFPPLAGSEWVNGDPKVAVQILLHGINGKLTVKGGAYQGQMPNFGGKFSDEELAAVLSHVRKEWGNTGAPVEAALVKEQREKTKDRATPWNGDTELEKLKHG
ncbi:cytochrome c [Chitinimonas sp.]|uniref:c-type cytochrome n=1 Tax=Chitinimonas sp. TaxID=1934313 RepID=UPI002F93F492